MLSTMFDQCFSSRWQVEDCFKFPFLRGNFYFHISRQSGNRNIVLIQKLWYQVFTWFTSFWVHLSPKKKMFLFQTDQRDGVCVSMESSTHHISKTNEDRIPKICIYYRICIWMSFLNFVKSRKKGNWIWKTRNECPINGYDDFPQTLNIKSLLYFFSNYLFMTGK